MRVIVDIETDGLLDTITKVHCLSYCDFDTGESNTLTEYKDIVKFVTQDDLTIIGHKFITFDKPALQKVLNIKITARIIDTLALSWYLFPERKIHGLEEWGVELGVIKPGVEDWIGDDIEVYKHRCQEDVKINTLLFSLQLEKLMRIYDSGGIDRFINYLSFKMECAAEQEAIRWKLDVDKCVTTRDKLIIEKQAKVEALIKAMPERVKFGLVNKPKTEKANGETSVAGSKWYYLLGQKNLPLDHTDPVEIEILREPGNPNSGAQLKSWLFSLGWIPQEFKYVKEEQPDGRTINRPIPQINTQDDGICPSIKFLFDKEPELKNLESLFILSHRIGILEGWLREVSEDGYLKAEIAGLTNTLRFIHKTIVNVPTIHKPYGEELRGCLTVPDDSYILCGSDVSGLEDSTKHHYMMYYDPDYVNEQRKPGYDSHLSIAVAGNMISNHEETFFKWYKAKGLYLYPDPMPPLSCKGLTGYDIEKLIDLEEGEQKEVISKTTKVRWGAKRVNFGAVYGAGVPKLMLTSGMDRATTTTLYNGYWKKNWSVKRIAKDTYHKTIDGQMWLYNPVSQFWYSLRFEKDKFSTLNQGTGVYCFDTWVSNIRKSGIRLCGQFHDEVAFPIPKGTEDVTKTLLFRAMEEANEQLNLNIKLSISVDFGHNYAETH